MSAGILEAARRARKRLDIRLAIDSDDQVLDLYRANFPLATAVARDVSDVFNGKPGAGSMTKEEREVASLAGSVDLLVGGPPCQGHSDLNNHTRREDPKNRLYLTMARATEVLAPKLLVIENVSGVRHDRSDVVGETVNVLKSRGYVVHTETIDLQLLGIPQRRRRFMLLASSVPSIDPRKVIEHLLRRSAVHRRRDVRWAIGDLPQAAANGVFDTASTPGAVNRERMAILFAKGIYNLPDEHRPRCHRSGDHSYVSVYGRLRWDEPAQTITTGFGCMGQGRFVHPTEKRTITPHEAARLQTFPDWFTFGDARRGVLAKAIGNAVPPLLMAKLCHRLLESLPA